MRLRRFSSALSSALTASLSRVDCTASLRGARAAGTPCSMLPPGPLAPVPSNRPLPRTPNSSACPKADARRVPPALARASPMLLLALGSGKPRRPGPAVAVSPPHLRLLTQASSSMPRASPPAPMLRGWLAASLGLLADTPPCARLDPTSALPMADSLTTAAAEPCDAAGLSRLSWQPAAAQSSASLAWPAPSSPAAGP